MPGPVEKYVIKFHPPQANSEMSLVHRLLGPETGLPACTWGKESQESKSESGYGQTLGSEDQTNGLCKSLWVMDQSGPKMSRGKFLTKVMK